MDSTMLYRKLKNAYSDDNLNQISAWIIGLYKNKQFLKIKKLSGMLSEHIAINPEDSMNRCFSRLIATYHPDKGNAYRNEIERIYLNGGTEELNQYAHIFIVQNKEVVNNIQNEAPDIGFEYEYEYVWDYDAEGYQYFDDEENDDLGNASAYYNTPVSDGSFYTAVKRKMYGSMNMEFPSYYLEDYDEIDMAEYDIENLDGIEHCVHVIKLDLSGNNLMEINELSQLKALEELYISGNNIYDIEALRFLKKLRFVDLSYNQISDVTPLLNLENLQYLNLTGNNITVEQLHPFKNKDVLIVS